MCLFVLGVVAIVLCLLIVYWPSTLERHLRVRRVQERVGGFPAFRDEKVYCLDFSGLAADDFREKLKYLHEFPDVELLWFAYAEISDDDLRHLEGLTKVRRLDLPHTPVSDEALVHLRGLTKLEYLGLGATSVTNDGLRHLAELKALRELRLDDTKANDEGVANLKQALPNCTIYH